MTSTVKKDDSQQATIGDVERIVGKAVADLTGIIGSFADDVSGKFEEVDSRLDGIDSRLDGIDVRLDKLEASYDRLLNTIDSFVARIDAYETENVARDAQLARLERWVEQIADKTGVKLDY